MSSGQGGLADLWRRRTAYPSGFDRSQTTLVKDLGGHLPSASYKEAKMTNHPNETELLVAIFQQAYPLEPQPSVGEYLHHFEFEVDQLGRLLRFFGLAEASEQSVVGWAPSHRLMRIIGERASPRWQERGRIVVSNEDRDFVPSICRVATADPIENGNMDAAVFGCKVLAILGLLETAKAGGFKPTSQMKELALARLLERAVEEKTVDDEEEQHPVICA
jgi:hypothetical protein